MEASQSNPPTTSDEPEAQNIELKKLLDDGTITQEQYDEAVANEVSVPPASAPANPTAPPPTAIVATAEQQQQIAQLEALNRAGILTDDAFDTAKSQVLQPNSPTDEQVEEYLSQSRFPNLLPGTRVKITGGPYSGRMGAILDIHYVDGIQQMIAASGTSEARFAEVQSYIVRTRDARTDLVEVAPGELVALSTVEGWARGES